MISIFLTSDATYSFDKLHSVIMQNSTSEWLLHLDMIVFLITSVCIIGTFIAVYNDDSARDSQRWTFTISELLPIKLSQFLKLTVEESCYKRKKEKKALGFIGDTGRISKIFQEDTHKKFMTYKMILSEISQAFWTGNLCKLLSEYVSYLYSVIKFRIQVMILVKQAESRRQIIYLLEKKFLGCPIESNETEIKSYLDCKFHLQSEGNYMYSWEFENVKDEKILCEGKEVVPISSYSYLDMVRCNEVQEAAIIAAKKYSTGSHGPRLLGGNAKIMRDLESVLAKFFSRDDALICATGYLACMSAIPAVCGKNDLIITDSRNHDSLSTGCKISGAHVVSFAHNDFYECEKKLMRFRSRYQKCWIIIESVYSMDGDIADLPACAKLAKQYDAKIMIDEAHGLGVLGDNGKGLEEHFNMIGAADMIVGTFSKSVGGVGGFICGNKPLIDFMDFHVRGSVFSAALTAYSCGGAIAALQVMQGEEHWRIKKLKDNIKYFRSVLISGNSRWPENYCDQFRYIVGGVEETAVIPVIFRDDFHRMFKITRLLRDNGYFVACVLYPACPARFPRFRVTTTSALSREIMHDFVNKLVRFTVETPVSPLIEFITAL